MNRSRIFVLAALTLGIGAFGCESHHHHHHHETGESEHKMEVSALPAAVTNAIKAKMPNATITEAERETKHGREVYSLDVKDGDKTYDVVVSPDGEIISTKDESAEKK
jgi:uncharacterized membrane protein YkoI